MTTKQNLVKIIFDKLYIKQWTIGAFNGNIENIIRTKSFDPNIKWLPIEPFRHFFADPFICEKKNEILYVLAEEFDISNEYGKISLLAFSESFNLIEKKILLDNESHLSYPFIFKENGKIYVFPEAGASGKLSCYAYNNNDKKLTFLKSVINLPIMDPSILKHNNKYWVFGTLKGAKSRSELHVFYSNNILGPYKQHPQNPVTNSLNGSRPAGNFIIVDNVLYRPSQNCENKYGESITINKIITLNETVYTEEPYMLISINKKNRVNKGIHSIHTINVLGDTIIVDGQKKVLYPFSKIKHRLIKYLKKLININKRFKNTNNQIFFL